MLDTSPNVVGSNSNTKSSMSNGVVGEVFSWITFIKELGFVRILQPFLARKDSSKALKFLNLLAPLLSFHKHVSKFSSRFSFCLQLFTRIYSLYHLVLKTFLGMRKYQLTYVGIAWTNNWSRTLLLACENSLFFQPFNFFQILLMMLLKRFFLYLPMLGGRPRHLLMQSTVLIYYMCSIFHLLFVGKFLLEDNYNILSWPDFLWYRSRMCIPLKKKKKDQEYVESCLYLLFQPYI